MKKYLLALVVFLLAFPAASEKLPQGLYEALTRLPGLQAAGQTLSEQEQSQMRQYQNALKGIIIVKVSFEGCAPCRALDRALNQEGLISLWREKGFGFYELSSTEDARREKPNFSSVWKAKSSPMMYFFKDGKLQRVLKGFDVTKQEETVRQIRNWTNSVR